MYCYYYYYYYYIQGVVSFIIERIVLNVAYCYCNRSCSLLLNEES